MERISTVMLLVLVVAVVIALVLFGAFLKLLNLDFNLFPEPPKAETPSGFEFLDVFGVVPQISLTEDGQPLTSSQVACKIAKDISSDFVLNGNYPHGASLPFSKDSVVGWGVFEVPWNREKQRPIYFNDLTDQEKSSLSAQSCAACSPLLDEHCLTKQLSLREFSGQKVCGTFSRFVHNSLETLKFGNSACSSVGSQTFGTDSASSPLQGESCSELCGGEDKITVWQADITNSSYLVSDKLEKGKSPPALYPSPSLMLYLVKWTPYEKPKEKVCGTGCKYSVQFLRIPKTSIEPQLSSSAAAEQLSHYLKNFKRTDEAGSLIPELRMVEVSDYTVSQTVSIQDFIGQVQDKSGFEFDVGTCSSREECLGKAASNITEYTRVRITKIEPKSGKASDGNVNINAYYIPGSTEASHFIAKDGIKKAIFLSPLQTLEAGKNYTVYLFNWNAEGELKEVKKTVDEKFCFNGKRFYKIAASKVCDDGGFQNNQWVRTALRGSGALDRTVVVLPAAEERKEQVGTDSCGDGVPVGDDCGKEKIEFDLRKEYTKLSVLAEAELSTAGELKAEYSTDRVRWMAAGSVSFPESRAAGTFFISEPFRFVRLTAQGSVINTGKVTVTG